MNNKRSPTRVLIVDDEEQLCSMLARYLSRENYECITALNAFSALNKIKHDSFSLVLSDINMPGMSGMDLLRYLKKADSDVAVIMVTGVMEIDTAAECLQSGAADYITKPFELPTVLRAVESALEQRELAMENRCYQEELERKVLDRTQELNDTLLEVEGSYKNTLEALVTALDAREHETQAHSQRVRDFTLELARQMGLSGPDLIHIGRGALLHDVGKIGVPDSILLKPSALTDIEWSVMKKHPRIGYDILRSIKFLSPAAEIVLAHQEWWNGNGYPLHLGGNDIPLGAKIFAVADTVDAITSDRCYRRARSFETAVEEIRRGAATQFDPRVVDAFLSTSSDTWIAIHESLKRSHANSERKDLLCRASY